LTLKEIGKKMGLTRERIRQIRRDALTSLYDIMEGE
jgi:DNA-directed RNA polymerase sigma subunit (sigma70/sigma32)